MILPRWERNADDVADRREALLFDVRRQAFDHLERGERGRRDAHTDRLFRRLLGAEMTLVVNNNAAAMFLALNTIAEGGEVVCVGTPEEVAACPASYTGEVLKRVLISSNRG